MMTEDIAGPGTMALFRLEFALLIWAVTLLLVWLGFAVFVSRDLLILGNRKANTPQLLCAVVAWGRTRQMQLIWTKVSWLAFAYVFSFVGAVVYGIQQMKMFARVDHEVRTVTHYAAVLEGLPRMRGDQRVEEKIRDAVAQATKEEVIGVSIAWDFKQQEDTVMNAVASLHEEREQESTSDNGPDMKGLCGLEGVITKKVLKSWKINLDASSDHGDIKDLLNNLETTHKAFVIFKSEESRDKAVEAFKAEGGIKLHDIKFACCLHTEVFAPEGLQWQNMHVTSGTRFGRLFFAVITVMAACAAWTVLLYLPYAHYETSFSYANGDEPGLFSEGLFTALVVGSQIALFMVCSKASQDIGYHSVDEQQKAYTVMYNGSLILNLVMDLILQTYLSYLQMVGVGAHVSDGRLLGQIRSLQEILESYPMQKSIGKLLFTYSWPSTFFVPFAAEPFVMVGGLHLARVLVSRDKRLSGENAEKAFKLYEMEQGRYADVIFNVILVACIPFVAPAYMAMLLGTFIFSHLYIYAYDHFKALRLVGKFAFNGSQVHWLGMQLFSIPVGILAAALVFKVNQMSSDVHHLGSGFLRGYQIGGACFGAMRFHIILHLLVLRVVVKKITVADLGEREDQGYAEEAVSYAATHFSTNPVHCLRSKYIYEHKPAQSFYIPGKEHLMNKNPAIGAFYCHATWNKRMSARASLRGSLQAPKDMLKEIQAPRDMPKEIQASSEKPKQVEAAPKSSSDSTSS